MSITVSISAVQTHKPVVDADKMSNSRRSPSLISVSVGVDNPCCQSPTDLFVASHWLERSFSRFSVTLVEFSRENHSTSQVLTTSHVVFNSTFTEGLLQKRPPVHQISSDWSTAVTSHAAVN